MKSKTVELPTKISKYEKPIPFDEKFKHPGGGGAITFTAKSFQKWIEKAMPITKSMKPCHHTQAKNDGIIIGEYVFYLRPYPTWHMASPFVFFTLRPTRTGLQIYNRTTVAIARFDAVVNIPILASQSILEPWMSLTPNEVLTLRNSVRRSKGNVAIAGLGLGWLARKVLERKQVTHLTIVEKCDCVADFFGKSLIEDFGDRLTIVHGDAYDFDWSPFDVSLWDVWQGYGEAQDDYEFQGIRRDIESTGKICIGWGQNVFRETSYL